MTFVTRIMDQTVPFLSETKPQCEMSACGLTLNIARQRLTVENWQHLLNKAGQWHLLERQRSMIAGDIVNPSEGRRALHTSLRSTDSQAPYFEEVQRVLTRMKNFARDIREGKHVGAGGAPITDVINIGIGGSEMGPHAVYHALRDVKPAIRIHFLSAVDGVLLDRILAQLDPKTTLSVISSKSFSTRETMLNAEEVLAWYKSAGIDSHSGLDRHIVLVSAKESACESMGLPEQNRFPMWDWVGGRFSVWGAIGLPLMIALGESTFAEFLAGAEAMDAHVLGAAPEENLPLTLALLAYWNATEHKMGTHCVLPYDERLRLSVAWLQQLEMESLGKSVTIDGLPVTGVTGQGVWGGFGNEAQHSFYQWLRDGTWRTSIDLIWCEEPGHSHWHHHQVLNANAQAQAEALVKREHPSTDYFNAVSTLRIQKLTPFTLGALMAMYEHKTTLLSFIYGLNAFDQPAVEFGKKLCRELEARLG